MVGLCSLIVTRKSFMEINLFLDLKLRTWSIRTSQLLVHWQNLRFLYLWRWMLEGCLMLDNRETCLLMVGVLLL